MAGEGIFNKFGESNEQKDKPQELNYKPNDTEKLEEAFFFAGLTGSKRIEQLYKVLDENRKLTLKKEETKKKSEIKRIENEIKNLRQNHTTNGKKIKEFDKRLNDLEIELKKKRELLDQLLANKKYLLEELDVLRIKYPERIFADEIKKLEAYNNLISEEAKKGYERDLEARELNKEEIKRQVEHLENCKNSIVTIKDTIEKYINFFRKIGITRKTSGFLVWSGYFTLPILGWFLGITINNLYKVDNKFFQPLLMLIADAFKVITASYGNAVTLISIFGLPLFLLVILCLLVFLMDKFLGKVFKFDWNHSNKKKKDYKKNNNFSDLLNPLKNFNRSDFTQLLASTPIIYMWIVIPLFIIYLTSLHKDSSSIIRGISEPGGFTYLGIAICLSLISVVMLYSMKVVEIRWHKLLDKEIITLKDTLITNIELVILVIVFIAVFLPGEFITHQIIGKTFWDGKTTFLIMILILLLAFGLSYGLIYRGIFRDYESLKYEIEKIDKKIDNYAAIPIIQYSSEEMVNYIEHLKELQKKIDYLWGDYDTDKTSTWNYKRFIIIRKWFSNEHKVKNLDNYFEPARILAIINNQKDLDVTSNEITTLEKEKGDISSKISEMNKMNTDIDDKMNGLFAEKQDVQESYSSEIARVALKYIEELTSGDSLYEMGKKLRTKLNTI